MEKTFEPILVRYGGANKSSFEMSAAELEQVSLSIQRKAREKAFYKGLPVYFAEDDKVMAEYPDGKIIVVNPPLK